MVKVVSAMTTVAFHLGSRSGAVSFRIKYLHATTNSTAVKIKRNRPAPDKPTTRDQLTENTKTQQTLAVDSK